MKKDKGTSKQKYIWVIFCIFLTVKLFFFTLIKSKIKPSSSPRATTCSPWDWPKLIGGQNTKKFIIFSNYPYHRKIIVLSWPFDFIQMEKPNRHHIHEQWTLNWINNHSWERPSSCYMLRNHLTTNLLIHSRTNKKR